jgi:beta-lactamase regulating signal transducer with metallopeptidase domain
MTGAFFVDVTVKATVLLILAWVTIAILRRGSAALRHRVWVLALCGLIVLPALSSLVPAWQIRVLPAPPPAVAEHPADRHPALPSTPARPRPGAHAGRPAAEVRQQPEANTPALAAPGVPATAAARSTMARSASGDHPWEAGTGPRGAARWSPGDVLLAAWGAGFCAVLLPALIGVLASEWRRRSARPVTSSDWTTLLDAMREHLAIRRAVELRQAHVSTIPLTSGVIRPVVLLPEGTNAWPHALRRAVLLHELAHVQRLDALYQFAGRLAVAIYWFHPLAWYALRRLRVECESACDDAVVQAGERPAEYAQQLLDLARSLRLPRVSAGLAMARTNSLEQRLVALFDARRSHAPLDRLAGRRLWVLGTLAVAAIAVVQLRPRVSAGAAPGPEPAVAQPQPVPDAPGNPPGRITGRVVRDSDGTAAGGATVVLLPPPPGDAEYYVVRFPLRRVVAGADGAFAFDGLAPGRYHIWANLEKLTSRSHGDRGTTVVLPKAGAAPGPGPVVLRLVAGLAVTARVRDKATGRPIPRATVRILWSDFESDPTTDAAGVAVLQPLTAARWNTEVWAEGYAIESRTLNLEGGADAEAEFLLGPGGALDGTVRDPAGKPLAGVGLSARRPNAVYQTAYVKTDANGHYRLEHLPRDVPLEINVSKTDYGRKDVTAQVTALTTALDITLEAAPRGGSIAGVVRNAAGGPIAGAELTNMGQSSSDVRKARTGPDGRFVMHNLYRNNVGEEVIVRAAGFAPRRLTVASGPPDRPAEVAIALEAGHRIKGRVVDERGNPLEGVWVYFAHGDHMFSEGGRGTTDADGQFAFDSLPPDATFSFHKGDYSSIDDRALPLDTTAVATVVMVPAGVLVGRVTDVRTGAPVQTFTVELTHSRTRQPGEPGGPMPSSLNDPGLAYSASDGRFKVGGLVAGMPLQVTVTAPGYEPRVAERVVVARPDRAALEEFQLAVIDPAALRTYGGRLLDAQGGPVPEAEVRLIAYRPPAGQPIDEHEFNWVLIQTGQLARNPHVTRLLAATTDRAGRFQFAGIPRSSEVKLAWWGPGIPPGRSEHLERTAEAAAGSIDITLPTPARIVGSVKRTAYPGAIRISAQRTDDPLVEAEQALEAGQTEFAIGGLAPGEYWVSVMSPYERVAGESEAMTSRTLASVKVTVGPGDSRRVEFPK